MNAARTVAMAKPFRRLCVFSTASERNQEITRFDLTVSAIAIYRQLLHQEQRQLAGVH
jgi:hypothetical protein